MNFSETPLSQQTIEEIADKEVCDRRAQMLETLAALNELVLQNDLSLDQLLSAGLSIILSDPWLEVEQKGAIFLTDEKTNDLVLRVQERLNAYLLVQYSRIKIGQCLCGKAAEDRAIVFENHVSAQHEIRYDQMPDHGHYCVPIIAKEKLLGVLNLYVGKGHENGHEETNRYLWALTNKFAAIIEHKKIEEALVRKKQKLEQAQEMACMGSWSWDVKTGEVSHSEVFEKILKKKIPHLKNLDEFLVLVPEKDKSKVREAFELALENAGKKISKGATQGEGSYDIPHQLIRNDGSMAHVRSMGTVYVGQEGFESLDGVIHDISTREKGRVLEAMGGLTSEYRGECRTPEEVKTLSIVLASFFAKGTGLSPVFFESAIHESLMNGLEYGILGLGSQEKTDLMKGQRAYGEVLEERCHLPENRNKKVRAHFKKRETSEEILYLLTIEDEGPGFDYDKLLATDLSEVMQEKARRGFHGLGLVTILKLAFGEDGIKYFPPGNKLQLTKRIKK